MPLPSVAEEEERRGKGQGEGRTAEETHKKEKETPGERGDKDRGGAEVLVPKRRGERRRRWNRTGGRRKERRSSEVMRFCTVGWFHERWSQATLLLL